MAGLRRHGYVLLDQPRPSPGPGDLLLIWNRYGPTHQVAQRYEAAGAQVVVAENGYLSPPGRKTYALALGHHNGAGRWPVGGPGRWDALGIELAPWRSAGDVVLLLPQRGIGPPGVAMPHTWQRAAMQQVRQAGLQVRLRAHPGVHRGATDPTPAFDGAGAAYTWGSGAAIKALVAGLPVFHDMRAWIGQAAAAAGPGLDKRCNLAAPRRPDRLPMLQALAWAQWDMTEIVSGEAWAWLLQR